MFVLVVGALAGICALVAQGARIPSLYNRASITKNRVGFLHHAPSRPYKSIMFFDMDDTLYSRDTGFIHEIQHWISLYCAYKLKIDHTSALELTKGFYQKYGSTPHGLRAEHNLPLHDYEDFLAANMNYDKLKPIPGLRSMLEQTQARLVLLTNAGQRHSLDTLQRLGLENLFEVIIHARFDEDGFIVKPNPHVYDLAVKVVDPKGDADHYYFVDDNSENVRTARLAGWKALQLVEPHPGTSMTVSTFQPDKPKEVIQNIKEIREAWSHLYD